MARLVKAASRRLGGVRATRTGNWRRPSTSEIDWIVSMMGEPAQAEGSPVPYVTVPAWSKAAAILPALSRETLTRSVVNYNALRAPHRRILRRAMAAGLLWPPVRDVIASPVCRAEGPVDGDHAMSLTDLVSKIVHQTVLLSATLRATDPTRKPVFQAIDDRGVPVAFVKVGWNDRTKRSLETEADVLARCEAAGLSALTPRRLHHGVLGDLDVLVLDPLPVNVRRHPTSAPPSVEAMRAIAALSPLSDAPLAASPYAARLREHVVADVREDAVAAVTDALDTVLGERGGTVLRFGAWHGDFVRWNMARRGSRTFVWDWEFFDDLAPLGLDAAHFYFEQDHIAARRPASVAVARMRRAATPLFAELGVGRTQTELSLFLYLVEALVRIERIETARAGGTTPFRDGLIDEIRRLAAGGQDVDGHV